MTVSKRTTIQVDRTGYPDSGEMWSFEVNNMTGSLSVACHTGRGTKSVSLSDEEADELFKEWSEARHGAGRR